MECDKLIAALNAIKENNQAGQLWTSNSETNHSFANRDEFDRTVQILIDEQLVEKKVIEIHTQHGKIITQMQYRFTESGYNVLNSLYH